MLDWQRTLEFTGVKTDRTVFDKAMMVALHARFSDDEAGKAVGLTVFKEMLKACMEGHHRHYTVCKSDALRLPLSGPP